MMDTIYRVGAASPSRMDWMPVLVVLGFIAALAVLLTEARTRPEGPVRTVDCHVAGKRAVAVAGAEAAAHFVTFELPGGSCMEFAVRGADYGALSEGDEGSLTYRGHSYLGFERSPHRSVS